MELSPALQLEFRTHLLDADFNARYFDLLLRRYACWDTWAKIVLASMAAIGLVGLKVGMEGWTILSAASGVLASSLLPVFRWPATMARIDDERTRWIELRQAYENAWAEFDSDADADELKRAFDRIRKTENTLERRAGIVPRHEGLLTRARAQVISARRNEAAQQVVE